VLALLLSSGASAQPTQSLALPGQSFFKNVRLAWEKGELVFYGTYRNDGHDVPLWLEWQAGKAHGRVQIDYIEQYGRNLPAAIRLVTLGKNARGKPVWYLGVVAPNSQTVEADGLIGDLELTDDAGRTDHYSFTLSGAAKGVPEIRALPR
jgi:hypothetical protein